MKATTFRGYRQEQPRKQEGEVFRAPHPQKRLLVSSVRFHRVFSTSLLELRHQQMRERRDPARTNFRARDHQAMTNFREPGLRRAGGPELGCRVFVSRSTRVMIACSCHVSIMSTICAILFCSSVACQLLHVVVLLVSSLEPMSE